jgi:hypothetical protein
VDRRKHLSPPIGAMVLRSVACSPLNRSAVSLSHGLAVFGLCRARIAKEHPDAAQDLKIIGMKRALVTVEPVEEDIGNAVGLLFAASAFVETDFIGGAAPAELVTPIAFALVGESSGRDVVETRTIFAERAEFVRLAVYVAVVLGGEQQTQIADARVLLAFPA